MPRTTQANRRVAYGDAQKRHIRETREIILQEKERFFTRHDWTRITPDVQGRRNTCLNNDNLSMVAEQFYIKAIAAWVPHWILPNHVPTCPHCENNQSVDINNIEWVDEPKILYGVRTHRYLDTVYYKCYGCGSTFAGYNEKSLKLDSASLIGIFNFHLAKGLAVDDEVYSHIVNHSHDTTASIYRRLALSVTDNYIDDGLYYCQAVMANKVQKERKHGVVDADRRQITLETGFRNQEATQRKTVLRPQEQSRYSHLRHKLMQKQAKVERKQEEHNDIDFRSILASKSDRNKLKQGFTGLGKTKLEFLIHEKKIVTARQLLAYNGTDRKVLPSWKKVVRLHFNSIQAEMQVLKDEIRSIEDEIAVYETVEAIFRDEAEGNEEEDAEARTQCLLHHQRKLQCLHSPRLMIHFSTTHVLSRKQPSTVL
jgi:hypothetical protein